MTDTKQLEECLENIMADFEVPIINRTPMLETLLAIITAAETAARLSELEMFKKIEVMDMSIPVAAHISRRYKHLQKGNR